MDAKILFHVQEFEDYTLVEFNLPQGTIEPKDLKTVTVLRINCKKGVIISGRGPIWLHSYLAHEYHPCLWVAHYDPRVGAVVVQSHTPDVKMGDIVE